MRAASERPIADPRLGILKCKLRIFEERLPSLQAGNKSWVKQSRADMRGDRQPVAVYGRLAPCSSGLNLLLGFAKATLWARRQSTGGFG